MFKFVLMLVTLSGQVDHVYFYDELACERAKIPFEEMVEKFLMVECVSMNADTPPNPERKPK